VADICYIWWSR